MIPDTGPTTDLYNMVTIKNPLNEDFIFGYDNKGKTLVLVDEEGKKQRVPNPNYDKRGNYMIKAGETRNFPKFIAQIGMKHLIDKILLKKDNSGNLVNNKAERDRVAKLIFVREEEFDRPVIPTDQQIVDDMNPVESDLDRVLQKNTQRLKKEQPDATVETPEENPEEEFDGLKDAKTVIPSDSPDVVPTSTDGTSNGLPSREQMVEHAVSTLKIDPQGKLGKGPNQGKTIAEVWESMSDAELYEELQIGEGDINA